MIDPQRLPPAPSDAVFAGFSAALLLAAVLVAWFDFVPVLDHVNLAFHEVGHPVFGLFGELMGWLGGTLGQFVFPSLCAIHFLRREQWLQAAACVVWWFENIRYVALYLGDARSQQLPLVGGGEHDWAYLLGRFGLLEYDTRLAGLLVFVSWTGWVAVWLAVAAWWWQGRVQATRKAEAQRRQRIIDAARDREAQRRQD